MVTLDEGDSLRAVQTCEECTEDNYDNWEVEVIEQSPPNCLLGTLKQMHFICFVLLFVAKVFPSGRGHRVLLNWKLLKALFSFITIPYYIYIICFAFKVLDKQFITFSHDSTNELYTVTDPIYIA